MRHIYMNFTSFIFKGESEIAELRVQLHPAITDLKGPSIFIHYRRISAIAIIRNKEKFCQGTETLHLLQADFCYSWIRFSGIQLYSHCYSIIGSIRITISHQLVPISTHDEE